MRGDRDMTNFERLKSDESTMASYMDCPYRAVDPLPQCEKKSCLECCVDWLGEECEPNETDALKYANEQLKQLRQPAMMGRRHNEDCN